MVFYAFLINRVTRFWNSSDGVISIIWGLVLPVVIGFLALGIEVSMWYTRKNDLQSATDAGAVATAYYVSSGYSLPQAAANEMARNNAGAAQNVSITVNNPPSSGAYSSNSYAVEVITTQAQSPLFASLFVSGSPTLRSRAVAVATPVTTGQGCIMALSTVETDDLSINGNTTVNAPGCIMVNNSMSSLGTKISGSSTVSLRNIYTSGGISVSGSASYSHTNPDITNGTNVPDPFSSLPMPSVGSCDQTSYTGKNTDTMTPGVYCGNTKINANANITMQPGTYIFNGGSFDVNGQATITGNGVTLVFANNSTVTINGGATMTLSAPTSGAYAGILFYGDRNSNNNTNKFNGGATMNLTGILYFPTQTMQFNGGLNTTGSCTKIVAYNLVFNGNSTLNTNCPAGFQTIPVPTGVVTVKLEE